MKLRTNKVTLTSTMLLGALLAYGCGDDDDAAIEDTKDSGSETSEPDESTDTKDPDAGTSTGSSSSDDESSNEDAGVEDAGTEVPTDAGSAVDADIDEPSNDDAGDGATVPSEPEFAPIERVASQVVAFANDLRGLAFSADGSKFFASGFVDDAVTSDRQVVVARFNADGSVDTTFGTDGYVKHNLVVRTVDDTVDPVVVTNAGDEQSLSLVVLASGELLVQANVTAASGLGTDVVLLKLNAAGQRVTSFGTDGVLRVDFGWTPAHDAEWPTAGAGPTDTSWDIKLDPSSTTEKVVVFGHGPTPPVEQPETGEPIPQPVDNDRYILRLLASDGSPDPEFTPYRLNTGGTFSDGARRGYVNADGSILSAGYTNYGAGLGNHIVAIRLLPNGSPDPDFGFGIATPGVVRTNPFIDDGGIAECYAFAQQSTGRYVTTGYGGATAAGTTSRYGWLTTDLQDLVSVGFTSSGLDFTYGTQATLAIQSEQQAGLMSTEDRGRDLIVLADDRVLHAGRFGDNPAVFVRLPNGEPDLGSGVDGRFTYDPLVDPDTTRNSPTSHFFKIALSPDGKSIAASTNNHPGGVLVSVLQVTE